jgi:hypothetical protein
MQESEKMPATQVHWVYKLLAKFDATVPKSKTSRSWDLGFYVISSVMLTLYQCVAPKQFKLPPAGFGAVLAMVWLYAAAWKRLRFWLAIILSLLVESYITYVWPQAHASDAGVEVWFVCGAVPLAVWTIVFALRINSAQKTDQR